MSPYFLETKRYLQLVLLRNSRNTLKTSTDLDLNLSGCLIFLHFIGFSDDMIKPIITREKKYTG
jgi:hypothetical protein